jgi:hypothetical protein
MGWTRELRLAEADLRTRGRAEVKRVRELERRAKEQEKLNALEQARLEVDTHNGRIELLLSIHKEPVEAWSWQGLLAALDPCGAPASFPKELNERLKACAEARVVDASAIERCRNDDREAHERTVTAHAADLSVRSGHRELAARVMQADLEAWVTAIAQLHPFGELEELGVTVTSEFDSRESVHCRITVHGPDTIPQEAKTLTATGRLSVKPMAKTRFHEIYQDYVCGSVLRTASEMFGFLPVEVVLVTASVGFLDPATGQFGVRPVLSVGFDRAAFSQVALDKVDPSDAIEGFVHRGDAKASRKTGTFVPVVPLHLEDLARIPTHSLRFDDALERLRREREEIRNHASTLAARLRRAHQTSSTEV